MKNTKTRNCDYCHQPYQYKRSTSRFCCDQHRVSYNQYGEKAKTKLVEAIQACYLTATDIRQNHNLANADIERQIIMLKSAIGQLEDDFWSAIDGRTNKHGGQVYKQCADCGHIMFGWDDELPSTCPVCHNEDQKFINR